MEKLRGTIAYVLSILDRPIYRTEIVKFVYMIDEIHYKHFGETITGLAYKWDNFGPNSDGIVKEADKLVNLGIVHMSSEPNQYGSLSYLYKLEQPSEALFNSLSDGEKYVIRDVTCHYRKHTLPQLIRASKQTFDKQYEVIEMKQSKKYQEIVKSLTADKGFVHGVEAVTKEMKGTEP